MLRASTFVMAALAITAGCQLRPDVSREDYLSLCAGCHGASGRGDGPLAEQWPRPVPDLTTLSVRNGGQYPTGRVISMVDGSTRIDAHGGMPIFWGEIEGELTQVRTADGGVLDVPRRVVDLAAYVERLQQ